MDIRLNKLDITNEETRNLIDHLYIVTSTKMILPDGSEQEISPDGSLGLFTYGYKGIIAWRKKREEIYGARIYSPFIDAIQKFNAKKKEENDGQ
jgi:hypothetical protein